MAKKRRSSRQAKLNKQYAELLHNAKMIYNDLQLALKLGEDTPSMERILREAGTRSGLKKPTKKSIKALKGLQTEAGVLNKAMWSVWNKPESREIVKEMFEVKKEEENERKRRKRELRQMEDERDELRDKSLKEGLTPEEEKQMEFLDSLIEDYATPEDIWKIERLIDQCTKVVNYLQMQKVLSAKEEKALFYGKHIIEELQKVLSSGDDVLIKKVAKACAEITRDYGVLDFEVLYQEGERILLKIVEVLYNTL